MTDLANPDEPDPEVANPVAAPVAGTLRRLREQLDNLEGLLGPETRVAQTAKKRLRPAWQRTHEGEARLPVAVAILAAIGLQIGLPTHLAFKPTWLLPAMEGALLVGVTVANPRRLDRTTMLLRSASVGIIALMSVANGWSSVALVLGLVNGTEAQRAGPLLVSGGSIYLTNIVLFSLWYWEWDRGGSVARAQALRPYPDFLFPQMTQTDLAPPT